MSYLIVIMTAPNREEAAKIVRILLAERLIACGNIVDSVSSFFWWKGKIEEEKEVLVIMKSSEKLFKKLSKRVTELHSYDVRKKFLSNSKVNACTVSAGSRKLRPEKIFY